MPATSFIHIWLEGIFVQKVPHEISHPVTCDTWKIMPWPSEVKTSSTYEEMNKNIKSKALTQTISNKNGRKQIFIRGFLWKKNRWNDSSFQWLGHLPPISPSISWDVANQAVFMVFRLPSHFAPKNMSTACTLRWCCIFYVCPFLTPFVILFSTNFCRNSWNPSRIPQDGKERPRG